MKKELGVLYILKREDRTTTKTNITSEKDSVNFLKTFPKKCLNSKSRNGTKFINWWLKQNHKIVGMTNFENHEMRGPPAVIATRLPCRSR